MSNLLKKCFNFNINMYISFLHNFKNNKYKQQLYFEVIFQNKNGFFYYFSTHNFTDFRHYPILARIRVKLH